MRQRRAEAELEVRVGGTRPETVFEVEGGAVGFLRETEELEESRRSTRCFVRRLLLVLACASDDFYNHALSADFGPAEPVNAADFTVERRIGWSHPRIPEEIGELLGVGSVLEVGRSAGADVNRVPAVDADAIRDDEPLAVERQRAQQGDPELRRIHVVIHSFPEPLVHLSAAGQRIAKDAELRTAGRRRLAADEKTVEENLRRAESVRQGHCECRHPPAVEDVNVGVRRAESSW